SPAERQGRTQPPNRSGGVLGPPALRRLRRGRRRAASLGNPLQPRTLLAGATGANAGGEARDSHAGRRRLIAMFTVPTTRRGTGVMLDETQQPDYSGSCPDGRVRLACPRPIHSRQGRLMRRGPKPAKSKEAQAPGASKSPKGDGAK